MRSSNSTAPRLRRLSAVLLLGLAVAGCKAELYSKLSEREANEMVALLMRNDIPVSRITAKDGSSTLQVEQSRMADAIELLKSGGYPRQSFTNMGEVFKSSGLIASPTEERARFVYALSEELSKTISDIDGVISARIHVVLPKNDLLRQDTTPSSASVFIRHDQGAQLKALLPQIKMLVANSIEGLTYEKVSVVFVPVDRTEAVAATASLAAGSSRAGGLDGLWGVLAAGGAALLAAVGGGAFWFGRRRGASQRRDLVLVQPSSRQPALENGTVTNLSGARSDAPGIGRRAA
jgi:type III secretion protein J